MFKGRKVVLIIATVFLVAGFSIAMSAYAMAGFNPTNLSTITNWEQNTKTFAPEADAPHTSLLVDSGGYGVRLEPSEGDSFQVISWSNSELGIEIDDKNGALAIRNYRKQAFSFMQINMDFQDRATVVKIPTSYTGSITIESGSGNVDASNLSNLASLNVNMSSGHVTLTNVNAAEVSLSVASGNLNASDLQANNVNVFASSGNISLTTVAAMQSIKLETNSGNHQLSDLNAPTISVRASSGHIDAERIDASDVSFNITSGNIDALLTGLVSDYAIESSIISGHLNVPTGSSSGTRHLSIQIGSGYANVDFSGLSDASVQSISGLSNRSTEPDVPAAPAIPAAS